MSSKRVGSPYRIGFFTEYYVGNVTFQKNLAQQVTKDPSVRPCWHNLQWQPRGIYRFLPLVKRNWSLRASLQGRARLEASRGEYDALFFHMQMPALCSARFLKRLPSMISLDATPVNTDEIGAYYGHEHGHDLVHRLAHQIHKRIFQTAWTLVPWSNWVRQSLQNDYGIRPEKIKVVPAGIDPNAWPLQRRAINRRRPRLLFVGGDLERKGGQLLIDCFKHHFREQCELHVVTGGSVAPDVNLNVYHGLTPNSSDLKELYASCDIFVLPTLGDASPWSILEAMSTGLPVIATRIGAIPEMVSDGTSGLLIEPGDDEALRKAIETLCEDGKLRMEMGQEGRAKVEEKFDANKNARVILDLLKQQIVGVREN